MGPQYVWVGWRNQENAPPTENFYCFFFCLEQAVKGLFAVVLLVIIIQGAITIMDTYCPDGKRPNQQKCVPCTCPTPFNSTPMAVNSIPSSPPHAHPMGVHRTCGESDRIKKNTHPKNFTARCGAQASR